MDVSLRTLLVRPRAAFETAPDPPSLGQAFALVLVVGCVGIVTAFPLFVSVEQLPDGMATVDLAMGGQMVSVPVWIVVGILSGFVTIFLFWAISAVVLHALARVAGGHGSFRRIVVYAGWSHAPNLVFYPVVGILTLWSLTTNPDTSVSVVLHGTEGFSEASLATFNGEGLVDAHSVLSYAVTVWIGYLAMGAVEVAYDLSRRRAGAVAVSFVLLNLLLVQAV